MTTLREAAKMALDALHLWHWTKETTGLDAAHDALRAAQPTAEDIAQDWDLLKETQAALQDAWAILKKLKAVQDAARELVESDPDSAADTEGDAFAAWCALVAAIDDADTLLCEFGESHE
jgi:hypothetical protein